MDYSTVATDELKAQLQRIEEHRAELEAAIKQKKAAGLSDAAQQVAMQVQESGYTLDEIMSELGYTKPSAKAKRTRKPAEYTQLFNPENETQVYTRGPFPGWLKAKMVENGLDPKNKEHRQSFKSDFLKVAA